MKYTFDSTVYVCEYGKAPRGTGHWAFIVRGASLPEIAPEAVVDRDYVGNAKTIFWVPGVWTLTEAKRRASVLLAACNVPDWAEIDIAP